MKGSCLCGQIRFEAPGDAIAMNYCHCSICRKRTGTAFASTVHVRKEGFRWLAGEELLSHYQTSPIVDSVFCSACGSRMPVVQPHIVSIPAGTLDEDPGVRPECHIFTRSKASWNEIADSLPQFQAMSDELMARLFEGAGDSV